MPAVFLSHTSIDKPFVEKIASDLKRLGIEPWVDKYEIKAVSYTTLDVYKSQIQRFRKIDSGNGPRFCKGFYA